MTGLTRRHLLGTAALGAGAAMTESALGADLIGRVQGLIQGGLEPELVTVTDTAMAAWWPTSQAADTVLRIARADGRGGVRDLRLESDRTVHVAAVDGLQPGTRYRYELRSGGKLMARSEANPGRFTTLHPPDGRLLATVAFANDLHCGEGCSGTIQTIGDESFPPCFRNGDYGLEMTRAAVGELAALKPDLVVANGDLTDRGRPADMANVKEALGGLGVPWMATRGNHDRRLPGACEPDGDCMRAALFSENAAGDHALKWVRRVGDRVAVVGLDSCDPDSGRGRLDLGGQLAWLDGVLGELGRENRIVILCFHHHAALQSNVTHPPPIVFGVAPDAGATELVDILARHWNVKLAIHGHTHRNYVAYAPQIGARIPFLENGATKEYPAGYAVVRVYEDGLMRTFHRMTSDFARDWTRTTAGQVYGRHALYTRGTLASRAFVTSFSRRNSTAPQGSITGPLGVPGWRLLTGAARVIGS